MTLRSFLLHIGSSNEDLSAVCSKLFPYTDQVSVWTNGEVRLYSNADNGISPDFNDQELALFFINGQLAEDDLSRMDEFLKIGPDAWEGWKINGVAVAFYKDSTFLYNGPRATTPVYFCRNEQDILISSELKPFFQQKLIPLNSPDFSWFQISPYFKPRGSSPVQGISKLNPGTVMEIKNNLKIKFAEPGAPQPELHNDFNNSLHGLHDRMDNLLKKRVTNSLFGIPLSGGCDSGLVAGIASKYGSGFQTFTMGTEEHNEFKEARQMSDFIGSHHHEVVIPDEDLIPAIMHGIYLNELADPDYAIGYAGLYFTYQAAAGKVNRLITGYGADLILGNFLNVDTGSIAETARKLLHRTSQTGELSPYVPINFNLEIEHPFMDDEIVNYIISMPETYKVQQGPNGPIDKFIEKELILKYDLMPQDLVHRKKKALHSGAGIGILFDSAIGLQNHSENFKSGFLFEAWNQLIFKGIPPNECDRDRITFEAKKH